jgi:hypothetical protein
MVVTGLLVLVRADFGQIERGSRYLQDQILTKLS